MATQYATATIVGNAAFTPDLHLSDTSARATVRVISNRRRFDTRTQEWVDAGSCAIDATCWGNLARNVAASVRVGDPLIIRGRLEESSWIDKENQQQRRLQMVADMVAHDLNRGTSMFAKVKHERPEEDNDSPDEDTDDAAGGVEPDLDVNADVDGVADSDGADTAGAFATVGAGGDAPY